LSFARAAEELKLTAPAVSMQIKELEAGMGISLLSLLTVGLELDHHLPLEGRCARHGRQAKFNRRIK